ncbi:hypothetical protein T07_3723 [Trichinella nelsoni]|uniref:Uncharacterized protein n=1 Tax=Trichinella nelsoni TaxID=6336 RepID=A0A0V0RC18_9BILA|nr:hypothetical protein T07_3723 [Trichinella nelsoni]
MGVLRKSSVLVKGVANEGELFPIKGEVSCSILFLHSLSNHRRENTLQNQNLQNSSRQSHLNSSHQIHPNSSHQIHLNSSRQTHPNS